MKECNPFACKYATSTGCTEAFINDECCIVELTSEMAMAAQYNSFKEMIIGEDDDMDLMDSDTFHDPAYTRDDRCDI